MSGHSLRQLFDLLEGKDDPGPSNAQDDLAIVVPPGGRQMTVEQKKQQQVKLVEESLLNRSAGLLANALRTFEFSDSELGLAQRGEVPGWLLLECEGDACKAREIMAVACNARLNKRDAPVVFDLATKVHTTIMRVNAGRKSTHVQLGFMVTQMTAPMPQYKEVIVVPNEEADEDWNG